jgi:hypothetical protein
LEQAVAIETCGEKHGVRCAILGLAETGSVSGATAFQKDGKQTDQLVESDDSWVRDGGVN